METDALAPGLYLVATPIGAARDITLRALDVLASADVLAAEDTRNARRLMDIHGVALGGRRLVAYHDHNGTAQRPKLISALKDGRSVAYVSDAGTPLVADPGFVLAREARAAGVPVISVPGPSALLSALTVAAQPTDRFAFGGFLPSAPAARRRALAEYADWPGTLVFFESPRRLGASLSDMAAAYGEARPVSVCRELTKRFEETVKGTLGDLAGRYAEEVPKGEIVVVLGPPVAEAVGVDEVAAFLAEGLKSGRVREVAGDAALRFGMSKRDAYQMALAISREADE